LTHLQLDHPHSPKCRVIWTTHVVRTVSHADDVVAVYCHDLTDGARCFKVGGGGTKNQTYWMPFTSTIRTSLARNPGPLPFPSQKLNLGLAEMQFPTVLKGLLALFSLFLIDILLRSQLAPTPPTLNFCANLDKLQDPCFQKVGVRAPMAQSVT